MDRCYVFSDLGGTRRLVGRLEHEDRVIGKFQYARSFLESGEAFPLDPLNLPLSDAEITITELPWLFGAIHDAGPDDWGRKVLAYRGKPATGIYPLISGSGTGVGSLLFSLSRDTLKPRPVPPTLDALSAMFEGVRDIEAGHKPPPHIEKLLDPGSGMGGARPKAVVEDDGQLWLAKFPARADILDQPASEYASLSLARLAGLTVPNHRLVQVAGRSTLLIQRFDVYRGADGQYLRHHYLSMASLLTVGKRVREQMYRTSQSYMGLAGVLTAHGARPQQDRVELFRRMVFNVLLGHVDDHGRNHGLLLRDPHGHYELAPVFDIAPSNGNAESVSILRGYQSIGIGRQGTARNLPNLLSAVEEFGLSGDQAREHFEQIRRVIGGWETVFSDAGVPASDIGLLRNRVLALS